MSDLIEKLSNLRSQYNCFDENEREVYHTLSEAIKVISERPEPCEDAVSRQAAIDALLKEVRLVDGYYVENDEVIDKDDAIEAIRLLPSAQPEPSNDDIGCSNCMYSGRPIYKSPCSECRDNSQWEMKPISRSHENGAECEEYVSNDITYFDNDGFHKADTVIAWKPLPEPYKAESEE